MGFQLNQIGTDKNVEKLRIMLRFAKIKIQTFCNFLVILAQSKGTFSVGNRVSCHFNVEKICHSLGNSWKITLTNDDDDNDKDGIFHFL